MRTPTNQPMWLRKLKPRFGLRTMLVLVTGLAVLLGCGAHFVRKVRRTNEIVARLEARDAIVDFGPASFLGIEIDENRIPEWVWNIGGQAAFADPVSVDLSDTDGRGFTDAEFAEIGELSELTRVSFNYLDLPTSAMDTLAPLDNLETIEFAGVEIRDDRLGRLGHLPKLWRFELYDHLTSTFQTCVSDETLVGLAQLRGLHSLKLSGCGSASKKGADAFRQLTELEHLSLEGRSSFMHEVLSIANELPNLKILEVRDGTINVEAAELISRMKRIESLDLKRSYVEEGSLRCLNALPRLKRLSAMSVIDRDVLDISQCAELEEVYVSGDHLTSDSLLHLAALRKLRWLNINADIDNEALLGFSQELPTCLLTYHGGNGTVSYRGGVQLPYGSAFP